MKVDIHRYIGYVFCYMYIYTCNYIYTEYKLSFFTLVICFSACFPNISPHCYIQVGFAASRDELLRLIFLKALGSHADPSHAMEQQTFVGSDIMLMVGGYLRNVPIKVTICEINHQQQRPLKCSMGD